MAGEFEEPEATAEEIQALSEEMAAKVQILTLSLGIRLGRISSEDELRSFVYGDHETRMKIWNSKEYHEQAQEDQETLS